MNDPTEFQDDELVVSERLRATFEAEAATLATRHQAGARPEWAHGGLGGQHQPAGGWDWRRSIVPIAAAAIVIVGLVGVTRLTQRQDGDSEVDRETVSDVVAPDQAAPAAAAGESQGESAGHDDEPAASGESAMATAAPGEPVPGVGEGSAERGSAEQVPAVSALREVCVTGIVAPDTLNVRAEPAVEGDLLGELSPGRCGIQQLEQHENGWTLVRVNDSLGNQLQGWVSGRYLAARTGLTATPSAPEYCVAQIVAPDTLTLRTGPSLDAPAVAMLKPDRCGLAYLGIASAGWLPVQVQGPDGSLYVGYVSEGFVEPAKVGEPHLFQANLIDRAWCAVSGLARTGVALRIGPSADSLVLAELAPTECRVFPTGDTDPTGEWSRVSVETLNRGGWVRTEMLEPTEQFVEFDVNAAMIGVQFDLRLGLSQAAPVNPTHFRVLSPDGRTVGTLDADGVIDLPLNLDPATLTFSGYLGDKYCLTTGRPAAPSNGTYPVVLSPGLCV